MALGLSLAGSGRQQQVQDALFGVHLGLLRNVFQLFLAHHVDGNLDEVADHGFHVAAHVADLGELAGLHLEKWRVGELGQAAGDFGFTHAGRPHHDDVLGHDLFGHLR